MNILGFDTSFLSYASIGFYFSDIEQLEMQLKLPLSQEEKLLFAIDSGFNILKKSITDIDVIAVGAGPGSFTGLRIGIATAKSMAWSLNKKVTALSSLDLLVHSLPEKLLEANYIIVPIIDARMNRVFSAVYNGNKRLTEDLDIEPLKLKKLLQEYSGDKVIFLGDGTVKQREVFQDLSYKSVVFLENFKISGNVICRDALKKISGTDYKFEDLNLLEPVYLRKSEAEEKLGAI